MSYASDVGRVTHAPGGRRLVNGRAGGKGGRGESRIVDAEGSAIPGCGCSARRGDARDGDGTEFLVKFSVIGADGLAEGGRRRRRGQRDTAEVHTITFPKSSGVSIHEGVLRGSIEAVDETRWVQRRGRGGETAGGNPARRRRERGAGDRAQEGRRAEAGSGGNGRGRQPRGGKVGGGILTSGHDHERPERRERRAVGSGGGGRGRRTGVVREAAGWGGGVGSWARCSRDRRGWGAGAAQQCGGGCQVSAVDTEQGTQRGAQRGGQSRDEKGGVAGAGRVRCWGGRLYSALSVPSEVPGVPTWGGLLTLVSIPQICGIDFRVALPHLRAQ
ncbi:hypothetical protein C8F04DRAFT_1330345 [Mycena alexandri]|uniref:Uncharacterized protein n=1 Tax=Mycena alexandri TaxID=1745969 RepID=A0AAD6WNL6_9AGAR|nr:hypothetical protein C8F04DRAFT_1330345 [Mycena alexandri]